MTPTHHIPSAAHQGTNPPLHSSYVTPGLDQVGWVERAKPNKIRCRSGCSAALYSLLSGFVSLYPTYFDPKCEVTGRYNKGSVMGLAWSFFWGQLPNPAGLGIYALPATIATWAGYAWCQKTRKGFADVL